MNTHKFRKLKVWQRSIQFVTLIYKITTKFPKEEKYGLVDQIRRAAVSICLNIAEGSGSGSDAEFVRFLRIAQRSAYEVIAALEITINLKMTNKSALDGAIVEVDQLSAMLTGLIKSLKADRSDVKSDRY
ncbi:four helix bundle protein [Candidatus Daviesbacteria bacterium]|nr:four helix bundle protein [Candidatus Daviesbacteria bacterium]